MLVWLGVGVVEEVGLVVCEGFVVEGLYYFWFDFEGFGFDVGV